MPLFLIANDRGSAIPFDLVDRINHEGRNAFLRNRRHQTRALSPISKSLRWRRFLLC